MKSVKETISRNISELRKESKMTQTDLANQLNYSDKAVSRWERGDTLPDIDTLCKICELFGVSFDYLISDNPLKQKNNNISKFQMGNRLTITLLAISLVWFVATFIYVYSEIILSTQTWKVFIWAIPVTAIVAQIFNWLWGIKKVSLFIVSVLIWSLLTAIYIQLIDYNLWLIFLLGIPMQIANILWSNLRKYK